VFILGGQIFVYVHIFSLNNNIRIYFERGIKTTLTVLVILARLLIVVDVEILDWYTLSTFWMKQTYWMEN